MDQLRYYFGLRVSEFRRLNGWTQKDLAEQMDVSVSFITKMERGLKTPTLMNAVELARYLGVHLDWLSFDEYPQFHTPPEFLIYLARKPKQERMRTMEKLKTSAEILWPSVGKEVEKLYGTLFGEAWESPYWKVFALLFSLQRMEDAHFDIRGLVKGKWE